MLFRVVGSIHHFRNVITSRPFAVNRSDIDRYFADGFGDRAWVGTRYNGSTDGNACFNDRDYTRQINTVFLFRYGLDGALFWCGLFLVWDSFEGSIWILFLLSVFYLFPSLSIGLLISTVAKNQFVAAQVSIVAGYLPAFLLSGFLFEINNMPYWLQIFTHIIPALFCWVLADNFSCGRYTFYFYQRHGVYVSCRAFFLLVVKKSKRDWNDYTVMGPHS